ncbi:MAG: hypothetical protein H7836_08395, partial [Magnetococcus sp. YQC-3]
AEEPPMLAEEEAGEAGFADAEEPPMLAEEEAGEAGFADAEEEWVDEEAETRLAAHAEAEERQSVPGFVEETQDATRAGRGGEDAATDREMDDEEATQLADHDGFAAEQEEDEDEDELIASAKREHLPLGEGDLLPEEGEAWPEEEPWPDEEGDEAALPEPVGKAKKIEPKFDLSEEEEHPSGVVMLAKGSRPEEGQFSSGPVAKPASPGAKLGRRSPADAEERGGGDQIYLAGGSVDVAGERRAGVAHGLVGIHLVQLAQPVPALHPGDLLAQTQLWQSAAGPGRGDQQRWHRFAALGPDLPAGRCEQTRAVRTGGAWAGGGQKNSGWQR